MGQRHKSGTARESTDDQAMRDQEVLRANRELSAYFKGRRTEREARAALKILKAFVRERENLDYGSRPPLPGASAKLERSHSRGQVCQIWWRPATPAQTSPETSGADRASDELASSSVRCGGARQRIEDALDHQIPLRCSPSRSGSSPSRGPLRRERSPSPCGRHWRRPQSQRTSRRRALFRTQGPLSTWNSTPRRPIVGA